MSISVANLQKRAPRRFQVLLKVLRHITARLLDGVDNVGFFHHVPLPKGHQLFQMVGYQLSSNVNPKKYLSLRQEITKGQLITYERNPKLLCL